VAAIETAHAVVNVLAGRRAGQAVAEPADDVPKRMATECVAAQEDYVRQQDQGANVNPKMAVEPEGVISIAGEKHDENQSNVQKVAMNILDDQGE